MLAIAIKVAAFALPALVGVVSAAIGARNVAQLREKTGDDSAITSVLSGQAFRHEHKHREAA